MVIYGYAQAYKTEREGQPDIYSTSENDKEINEAQKTAHATLGKFEEALKSNNPNFKSFCLKVKFETAAGSEHIWINNIILVGENYYGIVNNVPESITEIKFGQRIKIEKSNISDWMYVDGNNLIGGYTIRVLRNRMSKKEKKEFDNSWGIIIEE